jgi:MFS family permease
MTRTAFWRAWSIWAVTVSVTAFSLVYSAVYPLPPKLANEAGSTLDGVVATVFIGAFATVGAVLAAKRPGNPIGWLLSATGLSYAVGAVGLFLYHFPGAVIAANWLGWTFFVGIGPIVFVLLLFPTGSLPSRRWRPVAWAAGAGLAGWVLGNVFAPTILTNSPVERNPIGVSGPAGDIFTVLGQGSGALIAATGLAAIVSLLFRYRRAGTIERAQLKWLVYATALIVAALLGMVLAQKIMGPGNATNNLQNGLVSGAVALVPVAIGVAVLRYRLYDIDRIISRTLAYAIVTGLLIGIYAGLVLLATQVLGIHSAVAVAAATLAAAALFNPLRRRVQRRVDRRFNRARYDADRTVAAFAARLKDAVDLDTVRADLASVVQTALEPAHVWVWTGGRQPPDAARAAARIASSSPSSGSLPSMRSPST